jgi:hypothetical protein
MGTITNLLTQSGSSRNRWSGYLNHGISHFMMSSFGRFTGVRSFMVWLHRQGTPELSSNSGSTMVENVDVNDAVIRIRHDGFFPGLRLRKKVVEEFLSFCSTATCFGDAKAEFPFRYADKSTAEQRAGRPFKRGMYNNALRSSHLLQALTSDPQLVAIAREYLGTVPVAIQSRIWWSFPGPADSEEQRLAGQGFHYDIDSYRGLTFFFYLTNVGPSNGAHVYVRGTHAKKLWKDSFCIHKGRSDAEINESYGSEHQILFCGPAGYGFAEDIFGFHKGLHPESGDRLMIQVGYGLRDYWGEARTKKTRETRTDGHEPNLAAVSHRS